VRRRHAARNGGFRLQEHRPRRARLKIDGKKTPVLRPGRAARLVVKLAKRGKYPYLCTVPGHAAAGMKGVFTVR
jgi:uncharacterized cupredoxin-like copper-binding protein